jgi:hypothetical protein
VYGGGLIYLILMRGGQLFNSFVGRRRLNLLFPTLPGCDNNPPRHSFMPLPRRVPSFHAALLGVLRLASWLFVD